MDKRLYLKILAHPRRTFSHALVAYKINRTCLDTINYTIELVKTYLKCREYLSFLNGHYILENQISIGIFIDLECVRKFGYKAEFMITCFLHELHYFTPKME